MGFDNRRWTPNGPTVLGTAADGREDRPIAVPAIDGENPIDRGAFVTGLLDVLNSHGGPQLTEAQQAILAAAKAHEAKFPMWPADVGVIAQQTGYTRQWVYQVFGQLEELGLGTRDRRNPTEKRPFRTINHEGVSR